MQINSLYIEKFKLFQEFSIDFSKDVSILIGVNGSGKSTILESIAQIFSDVVLNEKSHFGFKLSYNLRLEEVLAHTATTSEFRTEYISVELYARKSGENIRFKVTTHDAIIEKEEEIEKRFGSIEKVLPSNIVIYYSGFSEIMKQICLPHDERLSINNRTGKSNIHRPFFNYEPALFGLMLTTLLSYEFGDIPIFLEERAKIKGVRSIKITLKKPSWGKGQVNNWWGAKGEVKTLLDRLDNMGTPLVLNEDSNTIQKGNVIIEEWQNEVLIITILGQNKLFEIREAFGEERTLFKVLNTLLIDGFSPKVEFSFIQDTGRKSFNVLSEGEQQAIVIRGLVELVNNENTLFLFDEPDTYMHPSWQRSFIENIDQLVQKNEDKTSQFLITTHSPQLLSNADPIYNDVQIIEDGEVVKITPKYYGRDISTILYEMMGVERRNSKVAKALSVLFNLIEDDKLEEAKAEYDRLAVLIGEDDPAIVRAKTQLNYLEEENEENN